MQKIAPCLWFDNQGEEAAKLYTSLFDNSKILTRIPYGDTGPGKKGSTMTVTFQLEGQEVMALNGGPHYQFTPAISLFVSCTTEQEVDALWRELSKGGSVLMELNKYPFSEKFGWVADRYGLSWQLNLGGPRKAISPFLMFVGKQHGRAEEAMKFYTSLFKGSGIEQVARYGAGQGEPEGTVMHARFSLGGGQFMAMESNREHAFTFTPAVSFFVRCETQEEIDRLWDAFLQGGESEQCGWVRDRYGVSWQIVPSILDELLGDMTSRRSNRVMEALLKMEKLDIAKLQQAYEQ